MPDSDPMASSASLLTTNATTSPFDPSKRDKIKQSQGQKDYAAALAMFQSKYGLHDSSALPTPIPPLSKKSPTSKSSSEPAMSLATMLPSSTIAPSPASRGKEDGSKRNRPSPLSLLQAKYRPRSWLAPSFPQFFSALPEGEEQETNNDGIRKADSKVVEGLR